MTFTARNALVILCFLFVLPFRYALAAGDVNSEVEKLRQEWAIAKYQTPSDQQLSALDKAIHQAEMLNQKYPRQPRIMTWYATALSTYSAIKGGLGVLPRVKKARELLEQAIQIDPRTENGLAQGVLGALYARVPGWPIAFGDKNKAREHLQKAIQIAPNSIDANYYYGDFLADIHEYDQAKIYLDKALHAPIRKGYEVQDRGRKREVAASFGKIKHR